MSPWGVHVSIIEAGAHKTKLLSGDILAEQWQSLWSGLSEEMKLRNLSCTGPELRVSFSTAFLEKKNQ